MLQLKSSYELFTTEPCKTKSDSVADKNRLGKHSHLQIYREVEVRLIIYIAYYTSANDK